MCWFTLTPAKGKEHHNRSSNSSCAADLVRVHRSVSPRYSDINVKIPISVSMDAEHPHHSHHQHALLHHHHRHSLHLHPTCHDLHHLRHAVPVVKLRGPGKRRCPSRPAPPPPTRDPLRCPPPSGAPPPSPPHDPVFRTQLVTPQAVRDTTRMALGTVESNRQQSQLRRVAGYEVLSKQVPWHWDCVSSTVQSSGTLGSTLRSKKRSRGASKYPPFGSMDRWL